MHARLTPVAKKAIWSIESPSLRRTAADSCTSPTTTSKPAAAGGRGRDVSLRLGFLDCPAVHSHLRDAQKWFKDDVVPDGSTTPRTRAASSGLASDRQASQKAA